MSKTIEEMVERRIKDIRAPVCENCRVITVEAFTGELLKWTEENSVLGEFGEHVKLDDLKNFLEQGER